jgi:hypothetical protein
MSGLSAGNFKRTLESQQQEPIEATEIVGGDVPESVEPTAAEPDIQEVEVPQEVIETAKADEIIEETEVIEPSVRSLITDDEPEKVEDTVTEVNDDLVIKYLSEKLGKTISLEDLAKEPVENPLESDPYMKEVFEWRKKTGRPIEDFIKFQKDFSEVGDLDVAREFLQLEYPNSTKEEINLELKKFITSEDDLDDDIAEKNWELKKYATKGRTELEKLKVNLGEASTSSLPSELQEKISYADTLKSQIDSNKVMQSDYDNAIKKTALTVDKMTLKLGDDKTIDFLVSEDIRKSIPDTIAQMPHWTNEDGSWNHRAVVEDGLKIQNFDSMIKLAYEQGLNSGKDELIRETKNTNLSDTGSSAQPSTPSDRPIYEDEKSNQRLKTRFKRKK